MGWQDQGRQDHGWWGHGTASGGDAPTDGKGDDIFAPGNYGPRIDAIAHTAFLHLPRNSQNHGSATFDAEDRENLRRVVTALIAARPSTASPFVSGLLDLVGDTAIGKLRTAAELVRTATRHTDLPAAAADLAAAMERVGLYKWPRFLRDAAALADSHARPILLAQATPAVATDAASAAPGRYVARNPEQWNGRSSVGDGECVALVKEAAGAPITLAWRQGVQVQGTAGIRPGTIIATFDKNGHYHGHAAIYLGQNDQGIQVIDQWNDKDKEGKITKPHPPSQRTLPFNQAWHQYVDRGEFYYVVE